MFPSPANPVPTTAASLPVEQEMWSGTPSQWQNVGWWIASILILPLPFALWNWLVIRNTRYVLTDQRLKISRGVFNRTVEDIELYRIKDTRLTQTFLQRMVKLGDVALGTSDASSPTVRLASLPNAEAVRDMLRGLVEARRDAKGVRELDVGRDAL